MANDYVDECEEHVAYWGDATARAKADLGTGSESYRGSWEMWCKWSNRLEGATRALAAEEEACVRAAEQYQDARGEGLVRY